MSESYDDWYSIVNSDCLEQGDILVDIPIIEVNQNVFPLNPEDIPVSIANMDVIVLTQTCDLEQDKVSNILCAVIEDYASLAKEHHAFRESVKKLSLRNGTDASCCLLPPTNLTHMKYAVVRFHNLYTLPNYYAKQYAAQLGERLRLNNPYKEYLSQSFAKHLMRVALENPIGKDFDTYKPWVSK